jgi:hypothetical protein
LICSWNVLWSTVLTLTVPPPAVLYAAKVDSKAFLGTSSEAFEPKVTSPVALPPLLLPPPEDDDPPQAASPTAPSATAPAPRNTRRLNTAAGSTGSLDPPGTRCAMTPPPRNGHIRTRIPTIERQ